MDDHDITALGATLSSPTRLRLLQVVIQCPDVTVGEAAGALGVSASTVVYHACRLEGAGLLIRLRHGRETWLRGRADRWRVLRGAVLACLSPGLAREVLALQT